MGKPFEARLAQAQRQATRLCGNRPQARIEFQQGSKPSFDIALVANDLHDVS
jgi:hypothetical protein